MEALVAGCEVCWSAVERVSAVAALYTLPGPSSPTCEPSGEPLLAIDCGGAGDACVLYRSMAREGLW